MRITLNDQTLELLPQRAVLWIEEETLLLSDPHFGKDASFRAHAIPVPAGGTSADLARLARLVELHCPRRLIILGDFFHTAHSQSDDTLDELRQWRALFRALEVIVVRGNHDLHAGDPPSDLGFAVMKEPFFSEPFQFCHKPCERADAYVLAGHVHPMLKLIEQGGRVLRAPCFLFGPRTGILPAYGTFTGGYNIIPAETDRVFLAGADQVVEIPRQLARMAQP